VVSDEIADACADGEPSASPDADGDAPPHPLTAGSRIATQITASIRCEELFISIND
jgi:hypothetical protein